MPLIATDAPIGGEIKYITSPFPGIGGGLRLAMLQEQVTVAASSATTALSTQLPPYADVISAGMVLDGAATLTTALRFGLGTTADPDSLVIGSLSVADNAKYGPVWYRGSFPIFSNSVIGTTTSAAAGAVTVSVFSGQTVAPIPANFLKPGDIIRMRGNGTLVQGGSSTVTIKVLSGTDIVIASGAPTAVSGDIFNFDVDMTIRSIGAGGSTTAGAFTSGGRTWVGTSASAAGAADIPTGGFLALTALDTTAAFAPTVTATFSGGADGGSAVMNNFSIEVIRPVLPASATAVTLAVTTLSNAGISTGTATAAAKVNCYVWFWDYSSQLPDRAA